VIEGYRFDVLTEEQKGMLAEMRKEVSRELPSIDGFN
jgi:hypothetical protein